MRYFHLLCASALQLAPVIAARCDADNCARAATGAYDGLKSARLAACSSFQQCTVTPASGEVTTAVTNCPTAVPAFASPCSGSSRYASACSCAGVTQTMVTAGSATTTPTSTPSASSSTLTTSIISSTSTTSSSASTATESGTCPVAVTGTVTTTVTTTEVICTATGVATSTACPGLSVTVATVTSTDTETSTATTTETTTATTTSVSTSVSTVISTTTETSVSTETITSTGTSVSTDTITSTFTTTSTETTVSTTTDTIITTVTVTPPAPPLSTFGLQAVDGPSAGAILTRQYETLGDDAVRYFSQLEPDFDPQFFTLEAGLLIDDSGYYAAVETDSFDAAAGAGGPVFYESVDDLSGYTVLECTAVATDTLGDYTLQCTVDAVPQFFHVCSLGSQDFPPPDTSTNGAPDPYFHIGLVAPEGCTQTAFLLV